MSKEGIYTFSFDKDAVLWNGQLACEWQSELNLDSIKRIHVDYFKFNFSISGLESLFEYDKTCFPKYELKNVLLF